MIITRFRIIDLVQFNGVIISLRMRSRCHEALCDRLTKGINVALLIYSSYVRVLALKICRVVHFSLHEYYLHIVLLRGKNANTATSSRNFNGTPMLRHRRIPVPGALLE